MIAPEIAEIVIDAMHRYGSAYALEEGDALVLARLAIAAPPSTAREQTLRVLHGRDDFGDLGEMALFLLGNAEAHPSSLRASLATILAEQLLAGDVDGVWQAVEPLPDEVLTQLIGNSASPIRRRVENHRKAAAAAEGATPPDQELVTEHSQAAVAAAGQLGSLASRALSAGRRTVAEVALRALLAVDDVAARNAGLPVLQGIGEVEDPVLAAAVVRAAGHRQVDDAVKWLSVIPTKALTSSAAKGLQRLVNKIWSADEDRTDAHQTLTKELGRLAPGTGWQASDVEDLFQKVAGQPMQDPAAIETNRTNYDLLHAFAREVLISEETAANAVLRALAPTFSVGVAPDEATIGLLMAETHSALREASVEVIRDFIASVIESPWLDESRRDEIELAGASTQALRGESLAVPISKERLESLAAQPRESISSALSSWLEAFFPPPTDVARIVLERVKNGLNVTGLSPALGRFIDRITPLERADLVGPLIEAFVRKEVSEQVLRAVQPTDADDGATSELLINAYGSASRNEERERVLQAWQLAAPRDAAARRHLIESVYVPMLRENKGSADIALRYSFLLTDPPHGTRSNLSNALQQAAEQWSLKRVGDALDRAGLPRPRKLRDFLGDMGKRRGRSNR